MFDLGAIFVCAVAVAVLWSSIGTLSLLLPVVLGHFFLFCNVFRIRRTPELIWGGVFLLNMGWHLSHADFSWWPVLLIQTPVTVALIGYEMRTTHYHGILAHRINPQRWGKHPPQT